MLTADGPKVIEFNVRFGDPEAQVVLPLIEEPLAPLLLAAAEGRLERGARVGGGHRLASHAPWASCWPHRVIPESCRQASASKGLEHLAHEYPDVLAFFAGVGARMEALVTSGGRVMTLVARDRSYQAAIDRVYDAVSRVRFDGMQFRRDIGRKALTKPAATAP